MVGAVNARDTRVFVLDVETVADEELIRIVHGLSAAEYRAKLAEEHDGKDFLPVTMVKPCALVVARVGGASGYDLQDVASVDEPAFRPAEIVRKFWAGYEAYSAPMLVTFNGRRYDLPVLELWALRLGLSNVGCWFNDRAKSYDQRRNRYASWAHTDVYEFVSGYGACSLGGGLDALSKMTGRPGKMGMDGSEVQGAWDRGEKQAISDYCQCDVLDTYFLWLRTRLLCGELNAEQYAGIVARAGQWLEDRVEDCSAYNLYLDESTRQRQRLEEIA